MLLLFACEPLRTLRWMSATEATSSQGKWGGTGPPVWRQDHSTHTVMSLKNLQPLGALSPPDNEAALTVTVQVAWGSRDAAAGLGC